MKSAIRHLALIPDGNRRWATKNGLKPWEGHDAGARKLADFLNWAFVDYDIPIVSVYALSTENLTRRTAEELRHLVKVYREYFKKLLESSLVHDHEVRVNILGAINLLPKELIPLLKKVMDKTRGYMKHTINFLMPYGGRYEIVHATRRIVEDVLAGKLKKEDISDLNYPNYLFTAGQPDPDVIVRTAEKRLSNFMLWQTAYSEVYFFNKYWPEFEKEDLEFVVKDFPKRQRRFGK